jgi:hypothetical protein
MIEAKNNIYAFLKGKGTDSHSHRGMKDVYAF